MPRDTLHIAVTERFPPYIFSIIDTYELIAQHRGGASPRRHFNIASFRFYFPLTSVSIDISSAIVVAALSSADIYHDIDFTHEQCVAREPRSRCRRFSAR